MVGVFVVLAWPAPGSRGGTRPEAPPVAGPTAPVRVEARAAAVLGAWDRRRAAAWASGDPAALSALYVPGATAGVADAAMLADWAARGLAVDRLTTQLLSVRVLSHRPRRWVLLVRDRVSGAVAAGAGVAEPLPAGTAAERTVVLRRSGGRWRVASVSAAPPVRGQR